MRKCLLTPLSSPMLTFVVLLIALNHVFCTHAAAASKSQQEALPNATLGVFYSTNIPPGNASWKLVSGSLPPGLALSGSIVSGIPGAVGQYAFTAQNTNFNGGGNTKNSSPSLSSFSIAVLSSSQVSITTTSLLAATVGASYSQTLTASGGTLPYSWLVTSGSLPQGLALTTNSGTISGTPTSAGTYNFTVQVQDSSSPLQSATRILSIVVAPGIQNLSITTTSLAAGTAGASYSQTLTASGGTLPYSWLVTSGSLPPGLALTTNSGTISGTPTSAGTYNFTVQVQDSSSPVQSATRNLSIVVAPGTQNLSITTTSVPGGTVGTAYSANLSATGGTPAYTWSIASGQLPAGLTLAATTGVISGVPSQLGPFSITAEVVDSSTPSQTATKAFTLTINSSTLDQYGGFLSMPSPNAATGIFRTEKFGNKWMFVDPANNAFFMTGVYVLDQDRSIDDMGNSYYNRTNAKYGDTGPTWGTAQLQRIQSWGFNSVGPYGSAYVLPTTTDYRWPGDQTNPVKVPFVGLIRPAYYGMTNQSNWAPQPLKNMLYGVSPYYTGYNPGGGVADYYDGNFDIFLTNELNNDSGIQPLHSSPYKQYMIGMNADDGDEMYGFGNGPDFSTGHNNAHLGWIILTMSPLQAANSSMRNLTSQGGTGFVYQDTTIYSKKALHDQLVSKYGTISALNAAWGSNYTTFDSSGTTITAEAVGTGDGSTLTFNKTLAGSTVTKFSLQIVVTGTAVAGDIGNGTLWGPGISGKINYSTGALTITFSSGHAPASGAAITARYVQNGWGIGSGLMDEDGRPSNQGWVGTDYTFLSNVSPNLKSDLDNFLYQIAAHYFSVCKSKIQAWMPGLMYLGPDTLGTWGAPSNRNVLKAAAQYIDVMAAGGGPAMSQAMLDFIYTYYGDKPFYVGEFRVANPDSAFFRYTATSAFSTQPARGQDYYNNVTLYPTAAYSANGSRPYVGILWWQYLDNWGEKNDWGLVTLSDNAYDGHEAVSSTVTCSPPLQNYACGKEERNYGDLLTSVKNAHQQIRQGVQK